MTVLSFQNNISLLNSFVMAVKMTSDIKESTKSKIVILGKIKRFSQCQIMSRLKVSGETPNDTKMF